MQDAKEEVRARLAIEDVVGEYVELKRAGRNFKGLSPFSGERTPSFFVSPEKNIWHDFSSNKGGDIFSFIMEVEGMDFVQALEHLARKANVDLSVYKSTKNKDIARRKKRLSEANELAAHYFQHSLLKNNHALEYVFKKRGLDKRTVTAFRLGYAPGGGRALVSFLTKRGFSTNELADAGLTNRFGGDLFKGRMMVPLMDSSGGVIGFTGRIIDDEPNAPKYLNTPQTLLYDKSWHVFGLSQAKEAIRKHDYAIVVEGNLDTVSSWQAGVEQVVASAGTAMTIHHLKTLSRLCSKVRLAFDGDNAGLAATERAIPIAQEAGVELSIISMPDGAKDPDELIKKDVALWQAAIDSAEPVVDWILRQYQSRHDITTAQGKRLYTTAGLEVVRNLKDPVEREHYLQKIHEQTGASMEVLAIKMNSTQVEPKQYKKIVHTNDSPQKTDEHLREDDVLSLGLIEVETRQLFENIDSDIFHGEERRAVVHFLKHSSEPVGVETPVDLQKNDEYVKILLLRADARYAEWNDVDRQHETKRLLRHIKDEHKKQQKNELDSALREAESLGDDTRVRELMKKIQAINKELNS